MDHQVTQYVSNRAVSVMGMVRNVMGDPVWREGSLVAWSRVADGCWFAHVRYETSESSHYTVRLRAHHVQGASPPS